MYLKIHLAGLMIYISSAFSVTHGSAARKAENNMLRDFLNFPGSLYQYTIIASGKNLIFLRDKNLLVIEKLFI